MNPQTQGRTTAKPIFPQVQTGTVSGIYFPYWYPHNVDGQSVYRKWLWPHIHTCSYRIVGAGQESGDRTHNCGWTTSIVTNRFQDNRVVYYLLDA